jgi:serine phosphatase RsbU (regulator of sigma subunit)/anti-sigma regulatory factor (Ser/Thr protein kinase)
MSPFAPFFYVFIMAELLLGAALVVRVRIEPSRRIAVLAAAYVWSATLAFANLVALPGIPPDLPTQGPQLASATSVTWRLGWIGLVAIYAAIGERRDNRFILLIPAALGAAGVTLAALWSARAVLPVFIVMPASEYTTLTRGSGVLLAVLAFLVMVRILRRRDPLDPWIAAATACAVVQGLSAIFAVHRFDASFFVGRLADFAGTFVVFGGVLADALASGARVRKAEGEAREQTRVATGLRVLTDVGLALATSLELPAVQRAAVTSPIPRLADFAVLNVRSPNGELTVAAAHHRDPDRMPLLTRFIGATYVEPASPGGSLDAVTSRRGIVTPVVTEAFIRRNVRAEWQDAVLALAPRSLLIVPLIVRDRTAGSLVLGYTDSGRVYEPSDADLAEEIGFRVAAAIDHAELYERERHVADRLQRAALPAALPIVDGWSFDAVYQAGSREARIGGDWYDVFESRDGTVVFSVGDVVGSGLESAVTMSAVRQAIRGAAAITSDPIAVLDAVDRSIESERPNRIVTAFIGILEVESGTLRYASAGHPPPFLREPDGTVRRLASSGLPLGVRRMASDQQPVSSIVMPVGAMLVLYTDGLTEADRDLESGESLLVTSLETAASNVFPAENIRAHVLAAVPQSRELDDVAILTVYRESTERTWRWTVDGADLAGLGAVRHAIAARLAERGFTADECFVAEVIAGEFLGNVARHAGGQAEVALDVRDTHAALHVLDRGAGGAAPAGGGEMDESGRGLLIVERLAGELRIEPRPGGGLHVCAVLPHSSLPVSA